MAAKEKIGFEELILELLNEIEEININDVALRAISSVNNPANRRAIQRAFKNLVGHNKIRPQGNARARAYTLIKSTTRIFPAIKNVEEVSSLPMQAEDAFNGVLLSEQSHLLLQHISQPVRARSPVGYDQNFLRSYDPNKTFYLTISWREELLNLGQVENKIRPAGTYARNILNRLLIDFSWNSSRLEGNTYSLLETKRLIELGETASGKDASEAQMILNHKRAIEYIIESVDEKEVTAHEVCNIHALLSENLLGDPDASGRIRQVAVSIGGSTYIPLENPHVLKECFDIFVKKFNQIEDPFEQSFFTLVHLSYLQAFEDVNKRTARLVANIPLIKNNLRPLSFIDVNKDAYVKSLLGIYETHNISILQDLYFWAYKRSSQQYSAVQQAVGEPNLLKSKHRSVIQDIIRTIILEKIKGPEVVGKIQDLLRAQNLNPSEASEIFKIIETEVISLHDGNIARFKIRPSAFQSWKNVQ